MAFDGIDGHNTQCQSGQDILLKALLPNCISGQQVVFDGAKFLCQSPQPPSWKSVVETTLHPFETDHNNYLDCAAGYTAIACSSVVVPSGAFSCQTTPGQINPATGLSSCGQAGCNAHNAGDTGYYSTTTCAKFEP